MLTSTNKNKIRLTNNIPFVTTTPVIQTKLSISSENNPYEIEADHIADKVVSMSDSQLQIGALVQRKCPTCEQKEIQKKSLTENITPLIQKKTINNGNEGVATDAVSSKINSSKGRGSIMGDTTRNFMETRFGTDFSNVKTHTDSTAIQLSKQLNAQAFTVGNDIYFNKGKYNPNSNNGKHLLAHELTHTIQQSSLYNGIQKQAQEIDPLDDPRMHPSGAPSANSCGAPSQCPAHFCQPYASESFARHQLNKMHLTLMAGIAIAVDSRVLPLWRDYLSGGTGIQNLSASFDSDFSTSRTTVTTSNYLKNSLISAINANPNIIISNINQVVDVSSYISSEINNINDPSNANQMDFNIPSEIPGNIAGGIGQNQTNCSSGALPSPFNDQRIATVFVDITSNANGTYTVQPIINYEIKDTIDLCPGNCGTSLEQIATVPMSQFEATGIAGDVPFIVRFQHRPPSFIHP